MLPRDNPHFALLKRARRRASAPRSSASATRDEADVRCIQANLDAKGSSVIAGAGRAALSLSRRRTRRALRARIRSPCWRRSERWAPTPCAALPRSHASAAPAGRGARTRARCTRRPHPAHRRELQRQSGLDAGGAGGHGHRRRASDFRAALRCWATCWSSGDASADLHRGLKEAVDAAGVDLVLACGPMMRLLFDDLQARRSRAPGRQTSAQLAPIFCSTLCAPATR